MQQTLERIYPREPGTDELSLRLHYERYQFASQYLVPGNLLDIACGSGYGSHYLANRHSTVRVVGVDADQAAISYAIKEYGHPSIEFRLSDALSFSSTQEFQTIVSLETIEHLAQPRDFVRKMASMLAPGGRFIASAPITPSMDANPFHLSDFTPDSFRRLFEECGLVEIGSKIQVQTYRPLQVALNKTGRKTRKQLAAYYLKNPNKLFLRIASLLKHGFQNRYLLLVFERKYANSSPRPPIQAGASLYR